jgi:hypothetical protein
MTVEFSDESEWRDFSVVIFDRAGRTTLVDLDDFRPVAIPGPDRSVECEQMTGEVALDASESFDRTGRQLEYSWSSETCEFDSPTSPTPQAVCPLGSNLATLVVENGAIASIPVVVAIDVVDATPPSLSGGIMPSLLWPPDHRMVDIEADVSSDDTCSATTITLVSVQSDEPDDAVGFGDGATVDDIQGAELNETDFVFRLRAERSGGGDGRTYTVTYDATDESGNRATQSFDVFVPHNINRGPMVEIEAQSPQGGGSIARDLGNGIGLQFGSASDGVGDQRSHDRMRRSGDGTGRLQQASPRTQGERPTEVTHGETRAVRGRTGSAGTAESGPGLTVKQLLDTLADRSTSRTERAHSRARLLGLLGESDDLETKLSVVEVLIEEQDETMNLVLVDHLRTIDVDARAAGKEEVSTRAVRLLGDLLKGE